MKWSHKGGFYFARCWNTVPSRGSQHVFPGHWEILLNQFYVHHMLKLTRRLFVFIPDALCVGPSVNCYLTARGHRIQLSWGRSDV